MTAIQTIFSRLYTKYRSSTFIKASSWYLFFSMAQRALTVITLPIFTRLLPPDDFGAVAIYTSWWTVFAASITLNVKAAVNRAKVEYPPDEFKDFISSALTVSMGTGVIVLALIWLAPATLVQSVFGLQPFYIALAVINALATTAIEVQLQTWIASYHYRWHSVISLLWTALQIGLSILLIVLPWFDPTTGRVLGLTFSSAVLGLYFFVRQMAAGKQFFNRVYWRYVITFCVPLIPHVLSGIVLAQFDRILIDRYIGRTEAGLYSFAYTLGQLVYMIMLATNAAYQPWFYDHAAQGNESMIRQKSNQYVLVFAGITTAAILFGPLAVPLLAPPSYWHNIAVLKPYLSSAPLAMFVRPSNWSNIAYIPIIMSSQFFILLHGFYVNVEMYEKKTVYISIGTALAAAVNIVANIILLPIYGYTVAAWTTLLAYVLLFLFHAGIVHFRLRKPNVLDFWSMCGMGAFTVVLATGLYMLISSR